METSKYDLVIVGSGPIGASTAYFLADKKKKIAVVSPEPLANDPDHIATYMYADGSVRWFFSDPDIVENTLKTAGFIHNQMDSGVDLSAIEDVYVFIQHGLAVPSLNVSGAKLVKHLLTEAQKMGVERLMNTRATGWEKDDESYVLKTDRVDVRTDKILFVTGPSLQKFFPDAGFEFVKRQTFVLDLPVTDERKKFPHLIVPLKSGEVHIFIKQIGDQFKMLLGQEDLFREGGEPGPEDHLKDLMEMGLGNTLEFLKEAHAENILWGFDAPNKKLKLYRDGGIFAASCGSAVRSSIGLGQKLCDILLEG